MFMFVAFWNFKFLFVVQKFEVFIQFYVVVKQPDSKN